jgi:hypothetical protein
LKKKLKESDETEWLFVKDKIWLNKNYKYCCQAALKELTTDNSFVDKQ